LEARIPVNTLRLWAAAAPDYFDFQAFSRGDFVGALAGTLTAESLTRVLYPDDFTRLIGCGKRLVCQTMQCERLRRQRERGFSALKVWREAPARQLARLLKLVSLVVTRVDQRGLPVGRVDRDRSQ
jgi:glucan phosphorylase